MVKGIMNRFYLLLCVCVVAFQWRCFGSPHGDLVSPVFLYYHPQKVDRGVVKWDCPAFAAYPDGMVIWRKNWAPSVQALTAVRRQAAPEPAYKLQLLINRYGNKTFKLTASSDPEVTTIIESGKVLTILGDWRKPRLLTSNDSDDTAMINEVNSREKALWSTLPDELREALTQVADFADAGAEPWRPEKLSITLQGPSRPRGEIIPWPVEWPQSFLALKGSKTMKHQELPGNMLDEVLRLLPPDGQPRAIRIWGEARYVELRFVFPGETGAN